jgi:hypothetical protein
MDNPETLETLGTPDSNKKIERNNNIAKALYKKGVICASFVFPWSNELVTHRGS